MIITLSLQYILLKGQRPQLQKEGYVEVSKIVIPLMATGCGSD